MTNYFTIQEILSLDQLSVRLRDEVACMEDIFLHRGQLVSVAQVAGSMTYIILLAAR